MSPYSGMHPPHVPLEVPPLVEGCPAARAGVAAALGAGEVVRGVVPELGGGLMNEGGEMFFFFRDMVIRGQGGGYP